MRAVDFPRARERRILAVIALLALGVLVAFQAAADFESTRKGYYLLLDANGVQVSRHTNELEALEAASKRGPGRYTIQQPNLDVLVRPDEGFEKPTAPTDTQEPDSAEVIPAPAFEVTADLQWSVAAGRPGDVLHVETWNGMAWVDLFDTSDKGGVIASIFVNAKGESGYRAAWSRDGQRSAWVEQWPKLEADASVTIKWQAPTTNEDGSTLDDLAGFRIYVGATPGAYGSPIAIEDADARAYEVTGLVPGVTRYFVMTALDRGGNESRFSNEVARTP